MADSVKIRIQGVKAGDEAVKPVSGSGFVHSEVPVDGFVIRVDAPGSVPLYVTDEDLAKAMRLREEKAKPVPVDALSWDAEREEE